VTDDTHRQTTRYGEMCNYRRNRVR